MSIRDQKSLVREQIRVKLRALNSNDRASFSTAIYERVMAYPTWTRAQRVLLFHALPDEPDVSGLIDAGLCGGKTVALPRSAASGAYEPALIRKVSQDCAPGRYGVVEPAPQCPLVELNQLDFVLVPGVAFDPAGRRLGRGKGYYDRLLERVNGIKCGVAFDFQVVAELPAEPHDVKLNCLATPTRWMECALANRL